MQAGFALLLFSSDEEMVNERSWKKSDRMG